MIVFVCLGKSCVPAVAVLRQCAVAFALNTHAHGPIIDTSYGSTQVLNDRCISLHHEGHVGEGMSFVCVRMHEGKPSNGIGRE